MLSRGLDVPGLASLVQSVVQLGRSVIARCRDRQTRIFKLRGDGIDVTGYIASCATFGRTPSGLTTIRCAAFGGPLFGPGNHAFTVTLLLSTGEAVSATVNWNVLPSTEP